MPNYFFILVTNVVYPGLAESELVCSQPNVNSLGKHMLQVHNKMNFSYRTLAFKKKACYLLTKFILTYSYVYFAARNEKYY